MNYAIIGLRINRKKKRLAGLPAGSKIAVARHEPGARRELVKSAKPAAPSPISNQPSPIRRWTP